MDISDIISKRNNLVKANKLFAISDDFRDTNEGSQHIFRIDKERSSFSVYVYCPNKNTLDWDTKIQMQVYKYTQGKRTIINLHDYIPLVQKQQSVLRDCLLRLIDRFSNDPSNSIAEIRKLELPDVYIDLHVLYKLITEEIKSVSSPKD